MMIIGVDYQPSFQAIAFRASKTQSVLIRTSAPARQLNLQSQSQ